MIYTCTSIKSLFTCFTPTINYLSTIFKRIFCCTEAAPPKPLDPERVREIKAQSNPSSPAKDKVSPVPVSSPHNSPEKPLSSPIPKVKPVTERIQDYYKRNREIAPSASDKPENAARTFNLESKKRVKFLKDLHDAQKGGSDEYLREAEANEQAHRELYYKEKEERSQNGYSRFKAAISKNRISVKPSAISGRIHALNLKESEFVYHNSVTFVSLREKPPARKEVSKEAIKAGEEKFKRHCEKHKKTPISTELDPEEKKRKIKAAHEKVLNHIRNASVLLPLTAKVQNLDQANIVQNRMNDMVVKAQQVTFAEVMLSIIKQPKNMPLTDIQLKTVRVNSRFLADLNMTLIEKKLPDPIATLRYFHAEFDKAILPVPNEKLHEWRSKLNALMDSKFDALKEIIIKLIMLQTNYNELPGQANNTREPILAQSIELLEILRLRVKGMADFLNHTTSHTVKSTT